MIESPSDAENVVRTYLTLVKDPSSLVDQSAVEAQAERVAATEDVIDRLHAVAELERLRNPDTSVVEAEFVAVAHAWASENRIPAAAFLELGVQPEVLRAAGFDVVGVRNSKARSGSTATRSRTSSRSRVTRETVQDAMLNYPTEFTIAEISEKVGASAATVRKTAEALVASGSIRKLPPDNAQMGPGRSPARYRVG